MSRRRKLIWVAVGTAVAGGAIAASVVGIGGPAHGAASSRTQQPAAKLVKYNGITLQEQSNGVILLPAAARYRGTSSGTPQYASGAVTSSPAAAHVPCHQAP